jgi:hypothetical protein
MAADGSESAVAADLRRTIPEGSYVRKKGSRGAKVRGQIAMIGPCTRFIRFSVPALTALPICPPPRRRRH